MTQTASSATTVSETVIANDLGELFNLRLSLAFIALSICYLSFQALTYMRVCPARDFVWFHLVFLGGKLSTHYLHSVSAIDMRDPRVVCLNRFTLWFSGDMLSSCTVIFVRKVRTMKKLYNVTKPERTYTCKQYEHVEYCGWTVPSNIPAEAHKLGRDNVLEHYWDEANNREVTVTRPAKTRAFWPEPGQIVNVGWKTVTFADGTTRDLYYCEAVIEG